MPETVELRRDLSVECDHVVLVSREGLDCMDKWPATCDKGLVGHAELEIEIESLPKLDLAFGSEDSCVPDVIQRS